MAIISCPSCQKQISDKASMCMHCDATIGPISKESMESSARVHKIKQAQGIQIQTFLALILFLAGFTIWYWDDKPDEYWFNIIGQGMIAVGFFWYLLNRVRLILLKRS
ncbi:hypothetical protein [Psychrobium sp. 1_MG-2023]|uniref:hypothetical protein n=1 Tax=Psychrobium sp. 1_MG-2023 TaxID=3062624 RepID=UPI000C338F9B|nr:hypothetical protein [Psychrobium sp. 1_MG-2023]MDP2561534.1 hypothetical protein [Psychrobium sp. 1_MG-2023]PKF54997.1 hypothetical protein CW748_14555 [Alteromonadales bacterium alter-6D02]